MTVSSSNRAKQLRVYPIAVVMGAAVGVVSVAFLFVIKVLTDFLWTQDHFGRSSAAVFVTCIAGGLFVGLINRAAEQGRSQAHDLAEAISDMEEVETKEAPKSRVIFGRASLGIVSLGFGGPLGPEAPLIALVSQLSSRMSGVLRLARDRAVELSVAGSLGVLFGVPLVLVGVSAEDPPQVSKLKKLSSRGPELLAAIASLAVITWLLPGAGIHPYHYENSKEIGFGVGLLWVALIAVLASTLGRLLATGLPVVRKIFVEKLPGGPIPIGVVSGAILGASALLSPWILFSGHHEIQALLDGDFASMELIGLSLLKVFVVLVCLAGGWYGGQIFPLAFIGSALALAIAEFVNTPAPLAFVAAGFVAASAVGIKRPVIALFIGLLLFPKETWIPMLIAAAIAMATTDEATTNSH